MKKTGLLWAVALMFTTAAHAQVGTVFEKEGLIFEVKSVIPYHVEVKQNAYPNAEHVNVPYNVSHGLFNYMVESIGPRAFEFDDLRSVQVSHSVNWLKDACFRETKLQRFDCPDELYDIFNSAFNRCYELDSVFTNRMLKRIHEYAFRDCHKLRYITFPATLEYIGPYAFQDCGFVNLTLPDVPFVMENGAFLGCDSLAVLNLGAGITDIPADAFNDHRLPQIFIPDQVTTIGSAAFKRQSSFRPLNLVCLGKGVASIARQAFLTSPGYIKDVICHAQVPPACNAEAFSENTYYYGTLYVPKESIEIYQSAETWKKFKNIREIDDNIIDGLQGLIGNVRSSAATYNLSGQRLTNPTHGINIINGEKIYRSK